VIDHVVLSVSDLERSKAFYSQALAPLGYELVLEFPAVVGFGPPGRPVFWVRGAGEVAPAHVAFLSPDEETVHAFHDAALAAGGVDNGPPGERPHYHPGYFGAFVLDPDGHNVEAVHHGS
jgi:catechol 2,3-dioxygenase-like lactoylglutathione lyase family enzyme